MSAAVRDPKPLGRKAYGSIGHLPNSRLGPGDRHVHEGQARICTEKARKGDLVHIQEKLDGSCVSVAKIDGEIVPLIRAGYRAADGHRDFQRQFDRWAMAHADQFDGLLDDGERVVGEWLALAHGTRYLDLSTPFVAFDIMRDDKRMPSGMAESRCLNLGIPYVATFWVGEAMPVTEALDCLGNGFYNAHPDDGPEGIVYRVEREGRVDFLAKWVNPAKVDGKYLPDITNAPAVWNWTEDGAS